MAYPVRACSATETSSASIPAVALAAGAATRRSRTQLACVDPEVQRLLEITQGVLQLAIGLIGKRSRWSEVASEMGTYVRDAGFSVVESFVGHGIGREMHEDPQVPNFVSAIAAQRRFRP